MRSKEKNITLCHQPESEEIILCALLTKSPEYQQILDTLRNDDFSIPFNKFLFECIKNCNEKDKDFDTATVSRAFKESRSNELCGCENPYIEITDLLQRHQLQRYDVEDNIKILKTLALQRKVSSVLANQLAKFNDAIPIDLVETELDSCQKEINSIELRSEEECGKTFVEVIDDYSKRLEESIEHLRETGKILYRGIRTRCKGLDYFLAGIRPTQLLILAARPGIGKTAFALNLAIEVARQGHKVAFFTYEMSTSEIAERLVAFTTQIEMGRIASGMISQEENEKIERERNSNLPIHIYDECENTVYAIKQKCRALQHKSGLDLVIVDYLGLLKSSPPLDNKYAEVSEISRSLKLMAMTLRIPVICLCQLSRSAEKRPAGRPTLADLRDSGTIEQDANIVTFLYPEIALEGSTNDIICIEVAKNRGGEIGQFSVTFNKKTQTFFTGGYDDTNPNYP